MGRNKQRATFEKRQREMARRERQAAKRARRQTKVDGPAAGPPEADTRAELRDQTAG